MKNHISFCVNNSKRLTFCFVNELQDVLRFLVFHLLREGVDIIRHWYLMKEWSLLIVPLKERNGYLFPCEWI